MSDSLLDSARLMIEAEIRRLISIKFPKEGNSLEELKYNEYMRRGSNLMIGLISTQRAQACRIQVLRAIELFQKAHEQFDDRWAPVNAMAKCHYLLGNFDDAMVQNKHALINCADDRDRMCSHHLLQSQIKLDLGELEEAEEAIVEAISIVPKNIHARKAQLRILSRLESPTILDQIQIIQGLPEFPRWANDFITVIDGEDDFHYIRRSEVWPDLREQWLIKVAEQLQKAPVEEPKATTDQEGTYRRLAKVAAFVGIGFALNVVFENVTDLVDLAELFGSGGTDSSDLEVIELGRGDVEPFNQISIAGDVEPFVTLAMEAGSISSLSPLAEADVWAHDLLIS